MVPDSVTGILGYFWRSSSVRVGLLVAIVSVTALAGWNFLSPVSACDVAKPAVSAASDHLLVGLLLVFVCSSLLFLTVLPLGTATILIAGYLLGPVAGLAQYFAVILTSVILFEVGRERDPEEIKRQLAAYPALSRLFETVGSRGLWVSCLLRLVPVVPSAVASLCASFIGLRRRDFILGTVLAGWVRPIGFACVGAFGHFSQVCGVGPV
jgi:uncharacterized membrane protein YdjX (TVP38/TMEM64 family)